MACALESRKAQSTLCIGDTVMLYSIVDDDPNKDYSGGYVFSEVSWWVAYSSKGLGTTDSKGITEESN